MNVKRFVSLLFLGALSVSLTACAVQSTSWPNLLVNEDTVYLANGAHVYAIRLADGSDVTALSGTETVPLRFPAEPDTALTFHAAPVLTPDGQLIVASSGSRHTLFSLNTETLAVNWPFDESSNFWMTGPLVLGETLYAPSGDGTLYALDFQGNVRWRFTAQEHGLWATPASDGKLIFVPGLDHMLYALDASTGKMVWQKELDGALISTPAVGPDGVLYIGSLSRSLYAIEASSGDIIWEKELPGWVYSQPALSGEALYLGMTIGTSGGKLAAVSVVDGSPLWEAPADGAVVGTPLVLENAVLYASEKGTVYAADRSGASLWTKALNEKIYSALRETNGIVLVPTVESNIVLFALDASTGAQKWAYPPK